MKQRRRNPANSISPPYKSWGEEQIARLLDRHGIPYQYEYPLMVQDRGKLRLYYPDFTLPQYGMIIEYFGVNGRPKYDDQKARKLQVYEQAGIEGLYLTRDSLRGDWPTRTLDDIEDILQARLDRFRQSRHGTK